MSEQNAGVALSDTHLKAENTVKELRRSGMYIMKQVLASLVAILFLAVDAGEKEQTEAVSIHVTARLGRVGRIAE